MGAWIYYVLLVIYLMVLIVMKDTKKPLLKFTPFFLLALYGGLRYNVGVDYSSYERIYYEINQGILGKEGIEIGYYLLVKFIGYIGGSQQLVFFIISLLTQVFTYKFIENESRDFVLSSLIYLMIAPLYLSSFNGIRQALAIAIFAYSLRYFKEKKLVKVIILNLFAGLFHTSALLMIPLYFVFTKRYKISSMVMVFLGALLVVKSNAIFFLLEALSYGKYIKYKELSTDSTLYIFVLIGLTVIFIFERYGIKEENIIYYNMNIISLMLILLALLTNNITDMVFLRFNSYFFYAYIVLVPSIVLGFRERRFAKSCVIVFSFLYYSMVVLTATDLVPYNFNFRLFI